MIALSIFIAILITQRVFELSIARHHEKILLSRGAVEVDRRGYRCIVLMHSSWFASTISEFVLLRRSLNPYWMALLVIFVAAQILRYWAITSLGIYWNTKILIAPNRQLIRKGPYRFIRHPNYLAVITEIAAVPLIFSCYITAIMFTLLNAVVLRRRIRLETRALNDHEGRIKKMPDGITT